MALYPIINTETGETKVIQMSVNEIMQWYKDNPEWIRNWGQGCASLCETGEWRDKLITKNPGWNDILQKANKAAGSQSQIEKI